MAISPAVNSDSIIKVKVTVIYALFTSTESTKLSKKKIRISFGKKASDFRLNLFFRKDISKVKKHDNFEQWTKC